MIFGPRFVGGWDTPDFGPAFSNYTYFRPCGKIWLSSVRRAQRLADEKKKKKERKKERKKPVLVKYKTADNYVGRPNKAGEITVARFFSYQARNCSDNSCIDCTETR